MANETTTETPQVTFTIDAELLQRTLDVMAQGQYPALRFIDVYIVMDKLKGLPLASQVSQESKEPDSLDAALSLVDNDMDSDPVPVDTGSGDVAD